MVKAIITVYKFRLATSVIAMVLMMAPVWAGESLPEDNSRAFLFDSTWPVPTSDAWRSSSTPTGGLPAKVQSHQLKIRSVELGPVPIFGILAHDSLFVLGGSPFLLHLFTAAQANSLPDIQGVSPAEILALLLEFAESRSATPYVAKIDTRNMSAEILELPKGDSPNYPGGIVAHENGYLYAVATSMLHEIDPHTLEITDSLVLPSNSSPDSVLDSTVYNTLQVSPRNGDLLLKTGSFGTGNGILVRVDIESLSVRAQSPFIIGSARATVAMHSGTEYVYVPGPTQTLRFIANDDSFESDDPWTKTYRTVGDGTTPGVGIMYLGSANTIVFPNNNTVLIGVTEPLSLGFQPTAVTDTPPRLVNATGTSAPGGSFTMLAGNPMVGGVIVAQDAVNGRLAAWRVGTDGKFDLLWVTDKFRVSIGSAVVIDNNRLYVDDRVCANEENQTNCRLYLVMLNLKNGKEVARSRVIGTEPSISHIVVGENEVYYVASEAGAGNGFVTKVSKR